jgi:O-antigen/teichoic acid export membrane protein
MPVDHIQRTARAILKSNERATVRTRLINGTALNLLATAFNQGSTLAANIIVARILTKEGFGEYAMVQSTLLTMVVLSQLATGYTVSKYVAEYRSTDPERAGRIMGLCALVSALMAGVGAILLLAMAPWLAGTMLKAPHLAISLMIGSGFLFFSAINGYQIGGLSALEAYGGLAKAGVASGIMAVAAISLGARWGGLNGAVVGLSMSAFVRCAIHNRA